MVPFFAAVTNSAEQFSAVSHPENKFYTTPVQSIPSITILTPENYTAVHLTLGKKGIWTTLLFQSNYLEKDMLCLLY